MMKTHQGSCHCGTVRFEAELDLASGTGKCNCSICTKKRSWSMIVKPEAFRLLSGGDNLGDYQFGTRSGHHRFCKTCGCAPFGDGHVPEIGGDYVGIAINCLDDVTDEELAAVPVHYANGRDNAWMEPPAVTAHL